jgi:hypothetical protein
MHSFRTKFTVIFLYVKINFNVLFLGGKIRGGSPRYNVAPSDTQMFQSETSPRPLEPKFAGSNSAEAVGFFRAKKKILRTPSFVREVKLWVPRRRFTGM